MLFSISVVGMEVYMRRPKTGLGNAEITVLHAFVCVRWTIDQIRVREAVMHLQPHISSISSISRSASASEIGPKLDVADSTCRHTELA